MIHAHDVLLDNRSLVQIRGHEMRRRANDLHAPLVRLVVGFCALEGGKERMVDVDDLPGHGGAERRTEDLHVACEDDEVDFMGGHELKDLGLLLALGFGSHGEVVEGDLVAARQWCEVGVIAHDHGNVDGELSRALSEQQIIQTVPDLRDHDHDAGFRRV